MKGANRTKKQLLAEVAELRQRVADLEAAEDPHTQAEEALRESEERFRTLSEAIFDGVLIHEDFRIVEASQTLVDMFGYEVSEAIGRSVLDFVTPESVQLIKEAIRRGYEKPYEVVAVRKDGSTFPAEGLGRVCRYQGRTARVVAFRDISKRKRAEEALRESEERYRGFVQNFHGIAFHGRMDWTPIFFHGAVEEITGYTEAELVAGKPRWDALILPDDLVRLFESGGAEEMRSIPNYSTDREYRIVRKDGQIRWVRESVRNLCDRSGTPALVQGAIYDITERKRVEAELENYRHHLEELVEARTSDLTKANEQLRQEVAERKRAEQAMRESEEQFRTIVETASSLLLIADAQGNNTYLSPNCERITGYTQEELLGKVIWWVHEDDTPRAREVFQRSIREGVGGKDFEYKAVKKSGELWYASSSWQPLRDGEGNLRGIVMQTIDITERKRAEEALRESEEKYRLLFATESDAIMVFDAETRQHVDVNAAALRLYGYTREEFLKLRQMDLTAEPEATDASIARTLGGEDVRIPLRYHKKKDGTVFPVEISAGVFTWQNRRTLCGIVRDITERKRAEEALRESEKRFRKLADLLPQTVFELDLQGNFIFANHHGFESFGYTQEDIDRGLNAIELFVPEHRSRMRENVQKILEGEVSRGNEYTAQRKDGSTFPVIIYSGPILHDGKAAGLRGIVVDITEHKKMDDALRESETALRALLNATDDAAFLMDRDTNLLAINENFSSRFGKRIDELIGTKALDLLSPELANTRRMQLAEVLAADSPVQFEDERGGRLYYSSYYPICDEKGKVTRVAVFSRDITEQRRAEERIWQLERQRAEIEKLAATGRMAARIAHEINNPLAGIKNSFQLVKDGIPKDHRHYKYVARIEKEINRIARIVRGMIDLHQPDHMVARKFQIDDTVRDVVALLEPSSHERHVSIDVDSDAAAGIVTMPEDPLRQVLYNILMNAIEASPSGAAVRIGATLTGGVLTIVVSDQGSGIPEDVRSRIFEPFFTTKKGSVTGGLGLGLSVTKGLLEAMGGSLDFESRAGRGTTFRVLIPVNISQEEGSDE
jgi:PAS domain S-box-containing protein